MEPRILILTVLEEVDWLRVPPDNPESYYFRMCDICYVDVLADITDGLPEEEYVRFVYDHREGLSVCENCLEAYLKEVLT